MKISQNSLDHYSNHPSNYTRYIRTLKFCLNKEKKTNSVLELTEKTNWMDMHAAKTRFTCLRKHSSSQVPRQHSRTRMSLVYTS
jgi:hypothetical protein